jgi:hypothetical protein
MADSLQIVDQLVTEGLQQGYTISVGYRGDLLLRESSDSDQIFQAVAEADTLYFHFDKTGQTYPLRAEDLLGLRKLSFRQVARSAHRSCAGKDRNDKEHLSRDERIELLKSISKLEAFLDALQARARRRIASIKNGDHGFRFNDLRHYSRFYEEALRREKTPLPERRA